MPWDNKITKTRRKKSPSLRNYGDVTFTTGRRTSSGRMSKKRKRFKF